VTNVDSFRSAFSLPLRDFNTAGVVAAHQGLPVSKLEDKEYPVHNDNVRVDKRRANDCRDAIDDVIKRI
jgi:hypothetical protein